MLAKVRFEEKYKEINEISRLKGNDDIMSDIHDIINDVFYGLAVAALVIR